MRITKAAIGTVGSLLLAIGLAGLAPAEASPMKREGTVVVQQGSTDLSAQSRRRRGPTRLRVYREYDYPGPNATRQCVAHYEQEFRQAGTVIVPRMRCWWQRG